MAGIKHNFKDATSAKSYKNVENAQKVVDKIEKEIEGWDRTSNWLKYVFVVNTEGRINILFMFDHADFNIYFHYILAKGHLVQVLG